MRNGIELMARNLLQVLDRADAMPPAVLEAKIALERVIPDYAPPKTNLSNPPKVDPLEPKRLDGTLAYSCPVCTGRQTLPIGTEDEMQTLLDDLKRFRSARVCAHEDLLGQA